ALTLSSPSRSSTRSTQPKISSARPLLVSAGAAASGARRRRTAAKRRRIVGKIPIAGRQGRNYSNGSSGAEPGPRRASTNFVLPDGDSRSLHLLAGDWMFEHFWGVVIRRHPANDLERHCTTARFSRRRGIASEDWGALVHECEAPGPGACGNAEIMFVPGTSLPYGGWAGERPS